MRATALLVLPSASKGARPVSSTTPLRAVASRPSCFESGSSSWSLGGWTVTTGLFANDWIVAYENPINRRGKPDRLELGYFDGTVGPQYEVITGQIDTSRLGNDKLIVAFANRPDESPFDAGYLLLVRKKG